jgi:hypothetical protein
MSENSIPPDHLPDMAVHRRDANGFDYRSLSSEDAQDVRECRSRICTEVMKTAATVIAIGCELIAVKKTLRHGAFGLWVESECGFSLGSAQNYMRVARLADKNATVAYLPLVTSYRMTGQRSSRWMLIAAAERAEDGEEMTRGRIRAAIQGVQKSESTAGATQVPRPGSKCRHRQRGAK